MGIIDRILQFIENKGISKREFYIKTTLSNGFLDKVNKIGSDKIEKILSTYPEMSIEWLITGKGDMFRNTTPCIIQEQTVGVPYYDVDFAGSFVDLFNDQTLNPIHNIVFEPFKDADLWCNVTGNSMADKINHGDIIAIRKVNNWQEDVLYGEIYAIVTEAYRTIKVIRKSKDENRFRLVPLNIQDHDENEIKKDSIIKVFEVLGAIKKFF